MQKVFDAICPANLKIKPTKCYSASRSVDVLGHHVSGLGIELNKRNTDVVSTFPEPKSVKQVGAFFGLRVFYRRLIKDNAFIARPPHQFFRKNKEFVWTENERKSFRKHRQVLTSAPVLAYPDFTEPFTLYTDASHNGCGNNLTQIQNGKERAILYAGRDFTSTKLTTTQLKNFKSFLTIDILKF